MNDHLHPLFQQILKDSHMPNFLDPMPINHGDAKDKLRLLVTALAIGRAKHDALVSEAAAHQRACIDIEGQICEISNSGHLDLEGKLFYSGEHAIQIANDWWDLPAGEKVRIFEVVR